MTDNTELKRLAEAAPEGPWFGPEYAPGTSYVFDVDLGTLLEYQSIDSEKDACLRYVAAANPAMVLALIAENERLQSAARTLDRLCYTDNGGELWKPPLGQKPDFSLMDQLKAENEALRKSLVDLLDLYDTDEGCRSLPQYIAGRAALSKGEQP